MSKKLRQLVAGLSDEFGMIPEDRKNELDDLSDLIINHLEGNDTLDIIVVCTHNSRRSQLGEAWINTLSKYFELPEIKAFSGGMETTAFNPRMVNAMKEQGFDIQKIEDGDNPVYNLDGDDHPMFSKPFDHPMNPQHNYLAIMVCDHADENCPVVHGMKYRVSLSYLDPKAFDDTPEESKAYAEKVKEIGRELYYLMSRVNVAS